MEILKVKISDLAVVREQGILISVGLGSCVGIALYDSENKVGGLAHILLPDSNQFLNRLNSFNPAKFADTAVPLLIKEMSMIGGASSRLKAKIAGGGCIFAFKKGGISVGEKNVEAVRKILTQLRIPIRGEDVGGTHGRTMRFFVDSGKVIVSTVGKHEKEL